MSKKKINEIFKELEIINEKKNNPDCTICKHCLNLDAIKKYRELKQLGCLDFECWPTKRWYATPGSLNEMYAEAFAPETEAGQRLLKACDGAVLNPYPPRLETYQKFPAR